MDHHLRHGDRVHTVTITGDSAFTGGSTHALEIVRREGGLLDLRIDGRPVRAYVARAGSTIWVQIAGRPVYQIEVVDSPRLKKKRPGARPDCLTTNTPAQVVKIEAAPGDAVTCGQTLVVLEAMKMEFKIAAPRDGVIEAIHCQVGDVVERGRELLRLAPETLT